MGWLDECRAKCKRVKYVAETMDWDDKGNHAGWLSAVSQLLDQNYVSIPGLYFQGVYAPRKLTGDVYTFGLMAALGREKRRVFMLEVYPPHVVSHRDEGATVTGSHVHLGDARLDRQIVRKVRGSLDDVSLKEWIERFRRHARVLDNGDHALTHPLSDSLFDAA
jgi:hypothetical protein